MQSNVEVRESNIELLRIIAALFILIYHCCGEIDDGWGGIISLNQVINYVVGIWGLAGVVTFMSITSFYLIDRPVVKKNYKSIRKIILKTILYAVGM